MTRSRTVPLLATAALLCAASALSAQHPPLSGFQREDEWMTLSDFRHVTALAAGDDAGYAGTAGGVEILPFLAREPSGTITAGDGLPTNAVTALAFDARDGRLWIGTPLGLARYDPFRGEVAQDPAGLGRLPIRELRVAPGGDSPDGATGSQASSDAPALYVLAGGEWYRLDPFSLSARPLGGGRPPPPARRPAVGSLPFLAGGTVRGERSGRPQTFRVTDAVQLLGGRILLGTWGGNVWIYEEARLAAEPVVFGLAGPGGGALGWDGERMWFTNPARPVVSTEPLPDAGDVSGVASSSDALGDWRHHYPGLEPGLPSDRVHDVASAAGRTFLATDAGLAVHDEGTGEWLRVPVLPELAGETLAVEAAADGVWVGTRRGLVALRWPVDGGAAGEEGDEMEERESDGATPAVAGRWLDDREVLALAADARALYVGTDLGLTRLAPDTAGEWGIASVTTAGREVRDLALLEDVLVVAHERGVEILPLAGGSAERFLVGEGPLDEPPLAVGASASDVWIATRAGVSRWDRLRRRWSEYGLADGLPALPVLDVLVQDERTVWFSTPGGVTRHRPRDAAEP